MAEEQKTFRRYNSQKKDTALDLGKLQPQDTELEEAILGALMLEKDAYVKVCDILKPESFYDVRNKKIYSAIQSLGALQRPIDMLTVTDQLRIDGTLEDVGGPLRITELTGRVSSSANVEYHARIVAQKYLARELISFCSTIEGKAFDDDAQGSDMIEDANESELDALATEAAIAVMMAEDGIDDSDLD